eukprot:c54113_g1_i1 orf=187-501(-)
MHYYHHCSQTAIQHTKLNHVHHLHEVSDSRTTHFFFLCTHPYNTLTQGDSDPAFFLCIISLITSGGGGRGPSGGYTTYARFRMIFSKLSGLFANTDIMRTGMLT